MSSLTHAVLTPISVRTTLRPLHLLLRHTQVAEEPGACAQVRREIPVYFDVVDGPCIACAIEIRLLEAELGLFGHRIEGPFVLNVQEVGLSERPGIVVEYIRPR